ncbi:hypothetical protein NNJEOMEG_01023 [Fundidesulfovibrio magnetotacticus]|uniref:Uncharacterized protein n=1 Tax=Fundidesulfovibrio magnetotacticus TaxID=2730080 RepID=A0A6V8LKF7_9BACT|nr:hypothetical protein [Fundidesulfovibrio magnetotacticus]GFK93192.1 hypothetical protein NNJEOMEG_01023 [Fundidesulfovibrio magnetotacticus]
MRGFGSVRRALLLLALVFALASPSRGASLQDATLAVYNGLYAQAVLSAQADLAHLKEPPSAASLWDIDADDPRILWSGTPGQSLVQVTTFTKGVYYQSFRSGQTITAGADLWVLPAPQMKTEVPEEDPLTAALNPRLATAMYLGLPPTSANDSVATFWASPDVLLRPAVDNAIDRHDLPASYSLTLQTVPAASRALTPAEAPAPGFSPTSNYVEWFQERQSAIFDFSVKGGPYPWTGLGYTYDWNPVAPDVVGGSEFVAPKGSPLVFVSLTPVADYYKK